MDWPTEDVSPSQLRGRDTRDRLRPFAPQHAQAELAAQPFVIVVVDVLAQHQLEVATTPVKRPVQALLAAAA
jgi:hypothetical protein